MRGKWTDFTINAKWDEENGFFKVFVNGEEKYDYEGATKSPGKNIRVYQKIGIYQSFVSRFKKRHKDREYPTQIVYYDEIRTSKTCDGLKLGELGYDCNNLN